MMASLALAAVVMCLSVGSAPAANLCVAASTLASSGQPADNGARIVLVETTAARTRDLTIESPSVGTVQVRLLLPVAFDEQRSALLPTFYLLHGGGGGYTDWTDLTDVEAHTASTDLLVAMPDTASSTSVRSPACRSAVYRGDVRGTPPRPVRGSRLVQRRARRRRADQRVRPGPGPRRAGHPDSRGSWLGPGESRQHGALARGTALYFSYGNGEPGPLDPIGTQHDILEEWVAVGADNFVDELAEAGIPATVNAYGPGTHSWPYWDRELDASMPILLEALGA